jgi:hypothetical protein
MLLLVALFAVTSLRADVTGTLTVNGKVTKLQHACAVPRENPFDKTKTDTLLLLTDVELPPAALHDEFALMKATFAGVTLQITADKSVVSGMIYSANLEKVTQFSASGMHELELTTHAPDRIAGRAFMSTPDDFFGNVFQYEAKFDVPVTKKPAPVPLKGTKLGAGGGEPGKAYAAYRKVLIAGDVPALRRALTAERAKETESPEFKELFPMVQAMQPKNVKVTGGAIDGDVATLLAEAKDGDEVSTGTITMQREGGAWKVAKEAWRTKSQ